MERDSGNIVRSLRILAAMALLAGAAGCGGSTTYDGFFAEIWAPAGQPVDQVELWVVKSDGGGRQVTPRDPDRVGDYRFETKGRDLQSDPYRVRLVPGETFDGMVRIVAVGLSGGTAVARGWAQGDLDTKGAVKVELAAIAPGCDADGDGFADCGRAGCCAAGEPFPDCDDGEAKATPVGFEDDCTGCGDAVDDDCDGTAALCRDQDGDPVKVCVPAWCAEESKDSPACLEAAGGVDCNPSDPTVFPGAPERCDGKDNDCNGQSDDGVTFTDWDGTTKHLGDACGTGPCAGGTVVCAAESGVARCSTDGNKAPQEDCATPEDDNCNGYVNDPEKDGCLSGDLDGDGVMDVQEETNCSGNPRAKYDSRVYPEIEDGPTHPAPEPCCLGIEAGGYDAGCDWNCDGAVTACAANDADGDGYPVGSDCNDLDPTVHPGAPEYCGDGIDQDCKGGDVSCESIVDVDGDRYAAGEDCNDNDASVHPPRGVPPDVTERCNGIDDNCDGYVDEGNPEASLEKCGSDVGECRKIGDWVCVHSEGVEAKVECVGDVRGTVEVCDGKDNDCSGQTDETFEFTDPVTNLTVKKGGDCGVGACAGGKAVCKADETGLECDSAGRATAETCDGEDDDCNGQTDDGLGIASADCTCTTKGVCLPSLVDAACADAKWVCGYGRVTGYESPSEKSCDAKDNDCDGQTDEDFSEPDWNLDPRKKGESCGTGACAGGTMVCNATQTDLVCSTAGNAHAETCNNADDDCDGTKDENSDASCDDQKDCTTDRCTGNQCVNTIDANECLISGTCHANHARRTGNVCQWCDPTNSQTAWSSAEGEPCDKDGSGCTVHDACQAGECVAGASPDCSGLDVPDRCEKGKCTSTGADTYKCEKIAADAGTACKDNDPCTYTDVCKAGGTCAGTPFTCTPPDLCHASACTGNPPPGQCSVTLEADWCFIASACVPANQLDPAQQCRSCQPLVSTTQYTNRTGDCDDGNACTTGDACGGGTCIPGTAKTCAQPNPACNPETGECGCGTSTCFEGRSTTCAGGTTCQCGTAPKGIPECPEGQDCCPDVSPAAICCPAGCCPTEGNDCAC